MLRRRFGRTEIEMPVFSTGGMRYQHKWQDTPLSEVPAENQQNLEDTINRSIELGINHIETARGYGSSERQLGLILPQFPRDEIIVQTKISPEKDAEVFRKNFMESLERLQLDYVDLLGIHGINEEETTDWALKPGGCLEMSRKLQEEGLVKHVGFSTHGPTHVIANAINFPDYGGFDYVNLHWYYIYQRNWPAVIAANQKDMGVFIISPTDKGGMLFDPPEKLKKLTKPLHPIVFNDLFCLNRPEVHTLSLGAAKPSDYDHHMQAVELFSRRQEFLPEILERLENAVDEAVGKNYADYFLYGVPEQDEFPGNINAQIILWLQILEKSFGMEDYAKMRYNLLGNAGHWFPGLNAEKMDREAVLEKCYASPFRDKIPDLLEEAHKDYKKEEEVKRLSESD